MSIRNLDRLFAPRSIALIGASRRPRSLGSVVVRNLLAAGFRGKLMFVNPHEASIESVPVYPSVAELPEAPDLAVICTPPATVPALIGDLGERGTKSAVVLTAGFGELGERGRELQRESLEAARPHLLRILGPNCLGLLLPSIGVNASFAHLSALPGNLAFVGQSGAVITSVLDWATARGIGFSHLVSLGGMADVDFGDVLDWLAGDASARAVLLYVEAITHARKFMSAARAAARVKPVVVIKAGRSGEGSRAAASHTGSLAGVDAVYDAAFSRAGLLRVGDLDELFDAVATLASGIQVTGDRLAIVSNGGGLGVLATDRLVAEGGRLATLSSTTIGRLDIALPPTWSRANPIDIIGDAGPERYSAAIAAVTDDAEVDAVLAINCPTAIADSTEAAAAVVAAARGKKIPVLASWVGESAAVDGRKLLDGARIPTFATPEKAVHAFMHLVRYRRNQALLMQTPPSAPELFQVDEAAARVVIEQALKQGRDILTEPEAKRVLAAYGIRAVETRVVADSVEAERAAGEIGGRVVLKILSPDITHKSDVGGVELNLAPQDVRATAARMLERVRSARPGSLVEGFTVQEMVGGDQATELIVGIFDDALFGPVVLFGHGGTAVELIGDKALALPPLNLPLARDMMARTRVSALLKGYRTKPAADADAIATTLLKVAQIAVDIAEVVELDINPLLASADGVIALDARIRVVRTMQAAAQRLAIRPYPKQLEKTVRLGDGMEVLLRPIRPEDALLLEEMIERTSPEDLRLRFFGPLRRLSPKLEVRLTQIDYDREMAFVAVAENQFLGVVRISSDPDNIEAEFAVLVRSDMKGRGLGWLLMQEIIAYARARGTSRIAGRILRENATMLRMSDELGFVRRGSLEDLSIFEVRLQL